MMSALDALQRATKSSVTCYISVEVGTAVLPVPHVVCNFKNSKNKYSRSILAVVHCTHQRLQRRQQQLSGGYFEARLPHAQCFETPPTTTPPMTTKRMTQNIARCQHLESIGLSTTIQQQHSTAQHGAITPASTGSRDNRLLHRSGNGPQRRPQ